MGRPPARATMRASMSVPSGLDSGSRATASRSSVASSRTSVPSVGSVRCAGIRCRSGTARASWIARAWSRDLERATRALALRASSRKTASRRGGAGRSPRGTRHPWGAIVGREEIGRRVRAQLCRRRMRSVQSTSAMCRRSIDPRRSKRRRSSLERSSTRAPRGRLLGVAAPFVGAGEPVVSCTT